MWIFIALVAVPIVEIALFIEMGGVIGLWPTIGLVIFTAVLGAALLRAQGFAAMARLQASLAEGGDPRGPLAHGALILAAGLLMLTPGFFTDTVGFLLLAPPVRAALIAWVGPRLAARAVFVGAAGAGRRGRPGADRAGPPRGDEIEIDDYVDVTDGPEAASRSDEAGGAPRAGASGWSRRPGAPDQRD